MREGNVFTPVSQSFCSLGREGVRPPPGQTPLGSDILPRVDTPEMATEADGTHPTGLHSCVV